MIGILKNRNIHLITTLIILSSLVSCGRDYDDGNNISRAYIGQKLAFSSILEDNESTYARKICDALRSKRLRVIGGTGDDNLSYEITSKNCQQSEDSKIVNTRFITSSDGGIRFEGEGFLVNPIVQTDTIGEFSSICTKVFANEEFEKISYPSFGIAKLYSFKSNTFKVIFGTKVEGDEDQYKVTAIDEYKVNLTSQAANSYGMITHYTNQKNCSNSNNYLVKKQVLMK